jgi:hypothetical protein
MHPAVIVRWKSRRWAWVAILGALVAIGAGVIVVFVAMPCRCEDSQKELVRKLAFEGFPQWAEQHPGAPCPDSLDEVAAELGRRDARDAWGRELILVCGDAGGIGVASPGPDGIPFTKDDIQSWE